jgi:hypothetical protein
MIDRYRINTLMADADQLAGLRPETLSDENMRALLRGLCLRGRLHQANALLQRRTSAQRAQKDSQ